MPIRSAALGALLAVVAPLAASAQGIDPLAERLRDPTFGGSSFGGSVNYGSLDEGSLTDEVLDPLETRTDVPLAIDRSGVDTSEGGLGFGVHFGRAMQRGRLVLGGELALSSAPGEPGGTAVVEAPPTGERIEVATAIELDYTARIVAKAGGLLTRGTMVYGLLGPAHALGEVEGIVTQDGEFVSGIAGDFDGFGYAVGLGVERLIDPNFSVGAQAVLHHFEDLAESEVDLDHGSIEVFLSARF